MATVHDDDDYIASQSYYSMAHSRTEIIKEQATIMVNGKLKEYQVPQPLSALLSPC